jgi:hypothetical protein
MIGYLLRGYLFDRLMRRAHGRQSRYGRYGRSRYGYGSRYGSGRRSRGGLFPLPHYSTRTRRGTRVSVGGCCLPIPLTLVAAAGAATRLLLGR